MKPLRNVLSMVGAIVLMAAAPVNAAAIKEIFSLGGGAFPQNHIFRIDLSGGTVTDLGSSGIDTPTNLAMAPDRTLYYMNPFDPAGVAGHSLYKATLNGTNTALVGAPTLVAALPTNDFGIIDGMTVGPDGKLYMTGYGKSEIYRFNPLGGVFEVAVKLSGGGEFRSDLAFDPITGNLVGLGIEPGSTDRTLFEIPAATVLTGVGNPYTWAYYGGAATAWATKVLNIGTQLGGNPDGLAFDPTNGDLYMSGDGTGVYAYNRTSAVRGGLIAGTGDGSLNGLGFDLAFQTREVPIGNVPLPGTLALALLALAGLGLRQQQRQR